METANNPEVTIIGVDAAVEAKNVGLARGVFGEGRLRSLEGVRCARERCGTTRARRCGR